MRLFQAVGLAFVVALAACTGNPVQTAAGAAPENQAETIAFALHNSYVVVAERAASIAENPDTPDAVRQTLITLHEAASPAAKELRGAAEQYAQVKAALSAGTSTAENVAVALAELNRVLTLAAPKLSALATAVGGAR